MIKELTSKLEPIKFICNVIFKGKVLQQNEEFEPLETSENNPIKIVRKYIMRRDSME